MKVSFAALFVSALSASALMWAGNAKADVVVAGSDYLQTGSGTFFDFGAPIGTVDFMSYPIGPGPTDTIVQRPDEITVNGSAGPIQIIALSLESTAPVAIPGVGTIPIFVTLAPGFLSSDTGTVSIADVMGVRTFTSTFDVFFDVCSAPGSAGVGCAPGATLVPETMITLSNSGTPWSPTPPPGTVPVTGPVGDILANMHTGLTVGESDFFPGVIPGGGGGGGGGGGVVAQFFTDTHIGGT